MSALVYEDADNQNKVAKQGGLSQLVRLLRSRNTSERVLTTVIKTLGVLCKGNVSVMCCLCSIFSSHEWESCSFSPISFQTSFSTSYSVFVMTRSPESDHVRKHTINIWRKNVNMRECGKNVICTCENWVKAFSVMHCNPLDTLENEYIFLAI